MEIEPQWSNVQEGDIITISNGSLESNHYTFIVSKVDHVYSDGEVELVDGTALNTFEQEDYTISAIKRERGKWPLVFTDNGFALFQYRELVEYKSNDKDNFSLNISTPVHGKEEAILVPAKELREFFKYAGMRHVGREQEFEIAVSNFLNASRRAWNQSGMGKIVNIPQ